MNGLSVIAINEHTQSKDVNAFLNESISNISKEENKHHVELDELLNAEEDCCSIESVENEEDRVSHQFKMLETIKQPPENYCEKRSVSRVKNISVNPDKSLSALGKQSIKDKMERNSQDSSIWGSGVRPIVIKPLKERTDVLIRKCINSNSRRKMFVPSKSSKIPRMRDQYGNHNEVNLNISIYSNEPYFENKGAIKSHTPEIVKAKNKALISIYNSSSKCQRQNVPRVHSVTQYKKTSLSRTLFS